MKHTCPNCQHAFETSKPKAQKQSAWAKDVRKPWQKNSPDHKWRNPWATQWTMTAKTHTAHKSADRRQRLDSLGDVKAYAEALNVTPDHARKLIESHTRIQMGYARPD